MLTRRSMLGSVATLPATAWPAVAARKKSTAFALVGDRYHNSDYIRVALGKTLVKELSLSIDFTDEVKLLNAENLAGYKLLIIFRDGMIWPNGYPGEKAATSEPPVPPREQKAAPWITAQQGKAVKDFAAKGGGILFYHNVTYISPDNQDFRHVLGAVTHGHPPLRPYKVKVRRR